MQLKNERLSGMGRMKRVTTVGKERRGQMSIDRRGREKKEERREGREGGRGGLRKRISFKGESHTGV